MIGNAEDAMKAILTPSKSSRVKAGVETFNDQLTSVFKDIEIFDYERAGKTKEISILREPLIARKVCKSFMRAREGDDMAVSNGMYGWALDGKCRHISIMHGGYKAFAKAAIKKITAEYYRTGFIYSRFEAKSASKADSVISTSEFTASNIKRDYGIESTVIHNYIDTQTFCPMKGCRGKLGIGEGQCALFVGRADYSKGFDILVEVAKKLPKITFICVVRPVTQAPLANMRMFSDVEHSDMPLFYNSADFLINTSRFEGFGYAIAEALSCNVSVITTNVGIVPEMESSGCITVKENTPDDFVNSMKEIKKSDGRKEITKKFSREKFKKEYKRIMECI